MFLFSIDPSKVRWPVNSVSVDLIERAHLPIHVMIRRRSLTDGVWSFRHNQCHVTAHRATFTVS